MKGPKEPQEPKVPKEPKEPQEPKSPKPEKTKTPKPEAGYDVGYCKPPEKHQFKKGNQANLNGRPKGSQNLTTIANSVMDAKIVIQKNGTQKKVSTKEAVLLRVFSQAVAGDRGAIRDALGFMVKMAGLSTSETTQAAINPLPVDSMHDILRDFLAHADDVGEAGVDELQTELATEGDDR